MAPSEEQVKAAISQLYSWAQMWRDMANVAGAAHTNASNLTLERYDVTLKGGEFLSTYNQFHQLSLTRLSDAKTTFNWIAGQLQSAANEYNTDEVNAVHRMTQVW